ncbi:MAG: FecCD family ABC transporter permease [Ruthenibacterium lactatiformans]
MEKRSFRSVPARLALLALAMLGAALLSLCLGAAAVSPREILSVLSGGGRARRRQAYFLYVRLPRTLGCLLAGAALAVSGAVIQTVLANPLAAPNIIGVNSGAGLGVALCCAVLPTAAAAVPFAAFLGAFAGVMLVLLISEKAGASRMTLVLAGVAISGMFGAGIDAVLTVFPDSLIGYSDFRIGGLANLSMGKVAPAAWVILLSGAALALATMDVLCATPTRPEPGPAGARRARGAAGAYGGAGRRGCVLRACWVCGACCRMVRRLVGGESMRLLAGCALGGAALLTVCDVAARTCSRRTSCRWACALAGGPFFLWLLFRKGRGHP